MRVLAGSAETCIGSILRVLQRIFYSKSFFSLRIFNIVKQSIKLIYLFHIPKLGEFWDVTIGSGSIIGNDNIEEFFNHVSKHKDIKDRSVAEHAPNYETDAACLVHML